jgi:hypothetical protein
MKTALLAIAIAAAATSASAQQASDDVSSFDSRFTLGPPPKVSLFDSGFSLGPPPKVSLFDSGFSLYQGPPARVTTVRVRKVVPEPDFDHFTATVKCDGKGTPTQRYVAVAPTYLGAIKAAIAKVPSDPVTGDDSGDCNSLDVTPKPEPIAAPNTARRVAAASGDDRRRGRVIHPGNRPRASRPLHARAPAHAAARPGGRTRTAPRISSPIDQQQTP